MEQAYTDAMQARNLQSESLDWMVEREINRLYELYESALQEVNLSIEEACLICDMLNGAVKDVKSANRLWATAEDFFIYEPNSAKSWKVDGPVLIDKLKNLSTIQCMAIIDASDRFWTLNDNSRDLKSSVASCFGIEQTC